jgi:S-DNA-T family DNA segregation ATPase FtsK/SpoIIIE
MGTSRRPPLKEVLKQFKIPAEVISEITLGNVIRYHIKLLPGATLDKLERRATEIALAIHAYGKPIIYPILHQGIVVLEAITKQPANVHFNEFNLADHASLSIPAVIGRAQDGSELVIDLKESPHTLIAGSTGSGKSVCLNSIICSILESNKDIKLALVDPKTVEFTPYESVKQLMYPIATKLEDTEDIIEDLIYEMNARFELMAKNRVSNIADLSKTGKQLPYIVLMIDEFADLVMTSKREFTNRICLLAQKSRAAGVHIILSTQRPAVGIVNGAIKANFPSRLCFRVPSYIDSRVILDRSGGERLMGKGDGLIIHQNLDLVRFKGSYLDSEDIRAICASNATSVATNWMRRLRSWL